MGTQFNVKLAAAGVAAADLQQDIEDSLTHVEHMMSTYLPDSEISTFNISSTTDWHTVSAEFCFSVEEALALSTFTDGSFDITVGPLVNLWGFGPGDMIHEPPTDEMISAAMDSVGYEHLQVDCARPALKKDISDLLKALPSIASLTGSKMRDFKTILLRSAANFVSAGITPRARSGRSE
jgi:thiamine biosynthesis lipoprotein